MSAEPNSLDYTTPEQIALRITYQEIAEVPVGTRDMLASHIARAIRDERESCAKIVDTCTPDNPSAALRVIEIPDIGGWDRGYWSGRKEAAEFIRNRN